MTFDRPAPPSRPHAFHHAVEATLRDTDSAGHVNNAVYVTWVETARTRYVFRRRGFVRADQLDFILASTRIDHRSPVLLHETVDVWCSPSRVGKKSWEMVFEGRARGDGRIVFEAATVLVQYDYAARRSVPVPEDWRRILERDLAAASAGGSPMGVDSCDS